MARDEPPIDLDAGEVVATVERLCRRIEERFEKAALSRTARRLLDTAKQTADRIERIAEPNVALRFAIGVLVLAIPLSLGVAAWAFHLELRPFRALDDFVGFFQNSVESLVFLGAAIAFLVTVEARLRRRRALIAVHELRVLAHLVDMHQLEKDPIYVVGGGPTTASSPERKMTAFELNRYLDYCGELLALIGKLAALYGKNLQDAVALSAIDNVEVLTTGLARKIWQKSMLLDRALESR